MSVSLHNLHLCLLAFVVSSSVAAAGQPGGNPGPNRISDILKDEAAGKPVDRRVLLAMTVDSNKSQAEWQAGRLQVNTGWESIENLSQRSEELHSYEAKREELSQSREMHLELARWCARKQFTSRARAHYETVLRSNPNLLEAREFLGHVQIGVDWVEKDTAEQAAARAREIVRNIGQWAPVFARTLKKVQSKRAAISVQGLEELEQIDASQTLPVLELIACCAEDDIARLCLKKIATLRTEEACLALVRIAVAREVSSTRNAAIAALKEYPESIYVPELLDCLAGSIEIRSAIVSRPNGRLELSTYVGQELRSKHLLRKIHKAVDTMSIVTKAHVTYSEAFESLLSEFYEPIVYVPAEVRTAAGLKLQQEAHQRKRATDSRNLQVSIRNKRIYDVLQRVTDEKIENQPKAWWSWWNERSKRLELRKPVYSETIETRDNLTLATGLAVGGTLSQLSCLIPGTLIQTEIGLCAVEKIRIGDKVVSQNVETGELCLKSVTETTIRPPEKTYVIQLDGDKIQATGGHLWWVSGEGWLRTSNLKVGQRLHTATGNTEIKSLEEAKAVQTHNLVVDQFSTYFVGSQRVLSYDNSEVKPTVKLVPGYEPQP